MKFLSSLLSALILIQGSVFAYSSETNFWKERRLALAPRTSYVVPRTLGAGTKYDVRSTLQRFGTFRSQSNLEFRNSKFDFEIFHIQDVHLNPEAQSNIAETVRHLIKNNQADLVALEGAFGPIDFSLSRQFAYPDIVQNTADYLLKIHKISGPVHAGMTFAGNLPPFVGVDDRHHYNANVEAYLQSRKTQGTRHKEIQSSKSKIQNDKKNIFNSKLMAFDQTVEAYRSGEMELGDYVAREYKTQGTRHKTIELFSQTYQLEKSLDFSKVEIDRGRLISELLHRMNQMQTADFLEKTKAYKSGQISNKDFYAWLESTGNSLEINVGRYTALRNYVRYLQMADEIDAGKIYSELRQAEREIYASLAQTDEERKLIAESRALYLEEKLVNFALTTEEWEEYRSGTTYDVRRTQAPDRTPYIVLRTSERFYEEALIRDQKIAENLKKAIKDHNAKKVVLVTGGFHSKGIQKAFREPGAGFREGNYVSFVPRISGLGTRSSAHGTSYLSVFAQEKTPLDQLFEGRRLFLTPPVTISKAAVGAFLKLGLIQKITGAAKVTTDFFDWVLTGEFMKDTGEIISVVAAPARLTPTNTMELSMLMLFSQGRNHESAPSAWDVLRRHDGPSTFKRIRVFKKDFEAELKRRSALLVKLIGSSMKKKLEGSMNALLQAWINVQSPSIRAAVHMFRTALRDKKSAKDYSNVSIAFTRSSDFVHSREKRWSDLLDDPDLSDLAKETIDAGLNDSNHILAEVRVGSRLAALATIEIKGNVLQINPPVSRRGYSFEREIAHALAIQKLADIPNAKMIGLNPDGSERILNPDKTGLTRHRIVVDGQQKEIVGLGHSARTIGEFLALLKQEGVTMVVDIRSNPQSQHFPHFNQKRLARSLQAAGIAYHWQGDLLGGHQQGYDTDDGFEHYMNDNPDNRFEDGVQRLLKTIREDTAGPVLLMCSEKDPNDCHRKSLLSYLQGHYGLLMELILMAVALTGFLVTKDVRWAAAMIPITQILRRDGNVPNFDPEREIDLSPDSADPTIRALGAPVKWKVKNWPTPDEENQEIIVSNQVYGDLYQVSVVARKRAGKFIWAIKKEDVLKLIRVVYYPEKSFRKAKNQIAALEKEMNAPRTTSIPIPEQWEVPQIIITREKGRRINESRFELAPVVEDWLKLFDGVSEPVVERLLLELHQEIHSVEGETNLSLKQFSASGPRGGRHYVAEPSYRGDRLLLTVNVKDMDGRKVAFIPMTDENLNALAASLGATRKTQSEGEEDINEAGTRPAKEFNPETDVFLSSKNILRILGGDWEVPRRILAKITSELGEAPSQETVRYLHVGGFFVFDAATFYPVKLRDGTIQWAVDSLRPLFFSQLNSIAFVDDKPIDLINEEQERPLGLPFAKSQLNWIHIPVGQTRDISLRYEEMLSSLKNEHHLNTATLNHNGLKLEVARRWVAGDVVWTYDKKDDALFAEMLGVELAEVVEQRKREEREQRNKPDHEKARDIFEKYGLLKLVEALKGSSGTLYQVITILLSAQDDDQINPQEMERLLSEYISHLNIGERSDERPPDWLTGRLSVDPFEYLEGVFESKRFISQLDDLEQQTLIEVLIRFAFNDLVDPEKSQGVQDRIKEILASHMGDSGSASFIKKVEQCVANLVDVEIHFQPAHIKTPLMPHQRRAAYLMRQSRQGQFGFYNMFEPRMGKTVTAYAAIDPTKKNVFVVPAKVLSTWREQAEEHTTGLNVVLVRGTPAQKAAILKQYRDREHVVLLMSIQDVRGWTQEMRDDLGNNAHRVIVDEAQAVENYYGPGHKQNSRQAEVIHELNADGKWFLSATPYTSGIRQLFSTFHMIHRDPKTGQVAHYYFRTLQNYQKLLDRGWRALKTIYSMMTTFSVRAVKSEYGLLYSRKKEIPPEQEGRYTLTPEQSSIMLQISKSLTAYLEKYNEQVSSEKQYEFSSVGPFLKRFMWDWAATDPTYLGEHIPTNYWRSLDRMIEKRAGKKGAVVARSRELVRRIARRYKDKGKHVVVINGDITGRAVDESGTTIRVRFENGLLIPDDEGETIDAQDYARHVFQGKVKGIEADLIVLGEKAGVGIQLDAMDWMIYAQVPENYVSYHQSSERGLGFNPIRDEGRQKEVEILFMIPEYDKEFLRKINGEDSEHVEHGTPQEIFYQVMMEVARPRFEQVIDGVPPRVGRDIDPSLARIRHFLPGYLKEPARTVGEANRETIRDNADAFMLVYDQITSDEKLAKSPHKMERLLGNLYRIVQTYTRGKVRADELGRVMARRYEEGEIFDLADFKILTALVSRIPNKEQKYSLMKILPSLYNRVWSSGYKGLATAARHSPKSLRQAAHHRPELWLPLYIITHGWQRSRHPGADVIDAIADGIDFSDLSDSSAWEFATSLIALIDLTGTDLLTFLAQNKMELINSDRTQEELIGFFSHLATLRTASPKTYEQILRQTGSFEEINVAIQEGLVDHFVAVFDLPNDRSTRNKIKAQRKAWKSWGGLEAPLRFMARLRAGDAKRYAGHIKLFREVIHQIIQGRFSDWRNKQSGPHEDKIKYQEKNNAFWDHFTRPDSVRFTEPVVVKAEKLIDEQKATKELLLAHLEDKEALTHAFGPKLADDILNDLANKNSNDEIDQQKRRLGREKAEVVASLKEDPRQSDKRERLADIGRELRHLRLRESVIAVRRSLQEKPAFADQAATEMARRLSDLEKHVSERSLMDNPEEDDRMRLTKSLRELIDNLRAAGNKKIFENIRVEFTNDPIAIMKSGELHPDLINCGNLFGGVASVATILDDIVSRNKTLALVYVDGELAAVSIVKIRQARTTQDVNGVKIKKGEPVVHIERPLNRMGYSFVPQIAEALARTKLSGMGHPGVTRDWYKGEADNKRLEVESTGAIGPTEFVETFFRVRSKQQYVWHNARFVVPPGWPSQINWSQLLIIGIAAWVPALFAMAAPGGGASWVPVMWSAFVTASIVRQFVGGKRKSHQAIGAGKKIPGSLLNKNPRTLISAAKGHFVSRTLVMLDELNIHTWRDLLQATPWFLMWGTDFKEASLKSLETYLDGEIFEGNMENPTPSDVIMHQALFTGKKVRPEIDLTMDPAGLLIPGDKKRATDMFIELGLDQLDTLLNMTPAQLLAAKDFKEKSLLQLLQVLDDQVFAPEEVVFAKSPPTHRNKPEGIVRKIRWDSAKLSPLLSPRTMSELKRARIETVADLLPFDWEALTQNGLTRFSILELSLAIEKLNLIENNGRPDVPLSGPIATLSELLKNRQIDLDAHPNLSLIESDALQAEAAEWGFPLVGVDMDRALKDGFALRKGTASMDPRYLDIPGDRLRAIDMFNELGIETVGDLVLLTPAQLLQAKDFKRGSLAVLIKVLEDDVFSGRAMSEGQKNKSIGFGPIRNRSLTEVDWPTTLRPWIKKLMREKVLKTLADLMRMTPNQFRQTSGYSASLLRTLIQYAEENLFEPRAVREKNKSLELSDHFKYEAIGHGWEVLPGAENVDPRRLNIPGDRKRADDMFKKLRIRTIKELLQSTPARLMTVLDFSEGSLLALYDVLKEQVFGRHMTGSGEENAFLDRALIYGHTLSPRWKKADISQLVELLSGDVAERAPRMFNELNIKTVGDLVLMTPRQLMTAFDFGETSARALLDQLNESVFGISGRYDLATRPEDFIDYASGTNPLTFRSHHFDAAITNILAFIQATQPGPKLDRLQAMADSGRILFTNRLSHGFAVARNTEGGHHLLVSWNLSFLFVKAAATNAPPALLALLAAKFIHEATDIENYEEPDDQVHQTEAKAVLAEIEFLKKVPGFKDGLKTLLHASSPLRRLYERQLDVLDWGQLKGFLWGLGYRWDRFDTGQNSLTFAEDVRLALLNWAGSKFARLSDIKKISRALNGAEKERWDGIIKRARQTLEGIEWNDSVNLSLALSALTQEVNREILFPRGVGIVLNNSKFDFSHNPKEHKEYYENFHVEEISAVIDTGDPRTVIVVVDDQAAPEIPHKVTGTIGGHGIYIRRNKNNIPKSNGDYKYENHRITNQIAIQKYCQLLLTPADASRLPIRSSGELRRAMNGLPAGNLAERMAILEVYKRMMAAGEALQAGVHSRVILESMIVEAKEGFKQSEEEKKILARATLGFFHLVALELHRRGAIQLLLSTQRWSLTDIVSGQRAYGQIEFSEVGMEIATADFQDIYSAFKAVVERNVDLPSPTIPMANFDYVGSGAETRLSADATRPKEPVVPGDFGQVGSIVLKILREWAQSDKTDFARLERLGDELPENDRQNWKIIVRQYQSARKAYAAAAEYQLFRADSNFLVLINLSLFLPRGVILARNTPDNTKLFFDELEALKLYPIAELYGPYHWNHDIRIVVIDYEQPEDKPSFISADNSGYLNIVFKNSKYNPHRVPRQRKGKLWELYYSLRHLLARQQGARYEDDGFKIALHEYLIESERSNGEVVDVTHFAKQGGLIADQLGHAQLANEIAGGVGITLGPIFHEVDPKWIYMFILEKAGMEEVAMRKVGYLLPTENVHSKGWRCSLFLLAHELAKEGALSLPKKIQDADLRTVAESREFYTENELIDLIQKILSLDSAVVTQAMKTVYDRELNTVRSDVPYAHLRFLDKGDDSPSPLATESNDAALEQVKEACRIAQLDSKALSDSDLLAIHQNPTSTNIRTILKKRKIQFRTDQPNAIRNGLLNPPANKPARPKISNSSENSFSDEASRAIGIVRSALQTWASGNMGHVEALAAIADIIPDGSRTGFRKALKLIEKIYGDPNSESVYRAQALSELVTQINLLGLIPKGVMLVKEKMTEAATIFKIVSDLKVKPINRIHGPYAWGDRQFNVVVGSQKTDPSVSSLVTADLSSTLISVMVNPDFDSARASWTGNNGRLKELYNIMRAKLVGTYGSDFRSQIIKNEISVFLSEMEREVASGLTLGNHKNLDSLLKRGSLFYEEHVRARNNPDPTPLKLSDKTGLPLTLTVLVALNGFTQSVRGIYSDVDPKLVLMDWLKDLSADPPHRVSFPDLNVNLSRRHFYVLGASAGLYLVAHELSSRGKINLPFSFRGKSLEAAIFSINPFSEEELLSVFTQINNLSSEDIGDAIKAVFDREVTYEFSDIPLAEMVFDLPNGDEEKTDLHQLLDLVSEAMAIWINNRELGIEPFANLSSRLPARYQKEWENVIMELEGIITIETDQVARCFQVLVDIINSTIFIKQNKIIILQRTNYSFGEDIDPKTIRSAFSIAERVDQKTLSGFRSPVTLLFFQEPNNPDAPLYVYKRAPKRDIHLSSEIKWGANSAIQEIYDRIKVRIEGSQPISFNRLLAAERLALHYSTDKFTHWVENKSLVTVGDADALFSKRVDLSPYQGTWRLVYGGSKDNTEIYLEGLRNAITLPKSCHPFMIFINWLWTADELLLVKGNLNLMTVTLLNMSGPALNILAIAKDLSEHGHIDERKWSDYFSEMHQIHLNADKLAKWLNLIDEITSLDPAVVSEAIARVSPKLHKDTFPSAREFIGMVTPPSEQQFSPDLDPLLDAFSRGLASWIERPEEGLQVFIRERAHIPSRYLEAWTRAARSINWKSDTKGLHRTNARIFDAFNREVFTMINVFVDTRPTSYAIGQKMDSQNLRDNSLNVGQLLGLRKITGTERTISFYTPSDPSRVASMPQHRVDDRNVVRGTYDRYLTMEGRYGDLYRKLNDRFRSLFSVSFSEAGFVQELASVFTMETILSQIVPSKGDILSQINTFFGQRYHLKNLLQKTKKYKRDKYFLWDQYYHILEDLVTLRKSPSPMALFHSWIDNAYQLELAPENGIQEPIHRELMAESIIVLLLAEELANRGLIRPRNWTDLFSKIKDEYESEGTWKEWADLLEDMGRVAPDDFGNVLDTVAPELIDENNDPIPSEAELFEMATPPARIEPTISKNTNSVSSPAVSPTKKEPERIEYAASIDKSIQPSIEKFLENESIAERYFIDVAAGDGSAVETDGRLHISISKSVFEDEQRLRSKDKRKRKGQKQLHGSQPGPVVEEIERLLLHYMVGEEPALEPEPASSPALAAPPSAPVFNPPAGEMKKIIEKTNGDVQSMADHFKVRDFEIWGYLKDHDDLALLAEACRKDPGFDKFHEAVLMINGDRRLLSDQLGARNELIAIWLGWKKYRWLGRILDESNQWSDQAANNDLIDLARQVKGDAAQMEDLLRVEESIGQEVIPVVVSAVLLGLKGTTRDPFITFAEQDRTLSPVVSDSEMYTEDGIATDKNEISIGFIPSELKGFTHLHVRGAVSRIIDLAKSADESGFVEVTLPLPHPGRENAFRIYASNYKEKVRSKIVVLRVKQTGEPESEVFGAGILGRWTDQNLERLQADADRLKALQILIERELLRLYTTDEESGKAQLKKSIDEESNAIKRTILIRIQDKFDAVEKMQFPQLREGEALAFYQRFVIYEMRERRREGRKGVVLKIDGDLQPARLALLAFPEDDTVILSPKAEVNRWESETRKTFQAPSLEVLTGGHEERDRAMAALVNDPEDQNRIQRILTNIDYLSGESDETFTQRKDHLETRSKGGVLIVDGGNPTFAQAGKRKEDSLDARVRRLEREFMIIIEPTPPGRPAEFISMLTAIDEEIEKRFITENKTRASYKGPGKAEELRRTINDYVISLHRRDIASETKDGEVPTGLTYPRIVEAGLDAGRYLYSVSHAEAIFKIYLDFLRWFSSENGDEKKPLSDSWISRYNRVIPLSHQSIGGTSPKKEKLDDILLEEVVENNRKVAIYTQSIETANDLQAHLENNGIHAGLFHGGVTGLVMQETKRRAQRFVIDRETGQYQLDEYGMPIRTDDKSGETMPLIDYVRYQISHDPSMQVIVVLYASAARGGHFPGVETAVFYDPPENFEQENKILNYLTGIDAGVEAVRVIRMVGQFPNAFLRHLDPLVRWLYFGFGNHEQVDAAKIKAQSRRYRSVYDADTDDESSAPVPQKIFGFHPTGHEYGFDEETETYRYEPTVRGWARRDALLQWLAVVLSIQKSSFSRNEPFNPVGSEDERVFTADFKTSDNNFILLELNPHRQQIQDRIDQWKNYADAQSRLTILTLAPHPLVQRDIDERADSRLSYEAFDQFLARALEDDELQLELDALLEKVVNETTVAGYERWEEILHGVSELETRPERIESVKNLNAGGGEPERKRVSKEIPGIPSVETQWINTVLVDSYNRHRANGFKVYYDEDVEAWSAEHLNEEVRGDIFDQFEAQSYLIAADLEIYDLADFQFSTMEHLRIFLKMIWTIDEHGSLTSDDRTTLGRYHGVKANFAHMILLASLVLDKGHPASWVVAAALFFIFLFEWWRMPHPLLKAPVPSDYLGRPVNLEVGRLKSARGNVVFLSRTFEPAQIGRLLSSVSSRPTVIITETAALAATIQKMTISEKIVGQYVGAIDPAFSHRRKIDLSQVELYLPSSPLREVMSGPSVINVLTSDDLPELEFSRLKSSSIFLRRGTLYLEIDRILRVLSVHTVPALRKLLFSTKAALLAA